MEHFVVDQISQHGYLAIFVLMVLESACIPIPSEVIMLFGGALAGGLTLAGVHVHLNIIGVGLAGTAGNLVGALLAYSVGRVGGRPLIERWGRFIFLRPHELDRAEGFFQRRGAPAIFFGRMVPVVRTFISLPAGIAEVPVARFSVLTTLGTLPWTFGLAIAGDSLASNWQSVSNAFVPISIVVGIVLVGLITWWYVRRVREARRSAHVPSQTAWSVGADIDAPSRSSSSDEPELER